MFSNIFLAGSISFIIPATWPAIREPVLTSPSNTALLSEPNVNFSDRLSGKLSGRLSGKLSELSHPLIQGGMGIGISMGGLAGAVAAEGAMGVISTANIGFTEEDFWQNPDGAAERSLRREIRKAREISGGKGLLAINAMVVTNNYRRMVEAAAEEGIDAVISGAGLPLGLPAPRRSRDGLPPCCPQPL